MTTTFLRSLVLVSLVVTVAGICPPCGPSDVITLDEPDPFTPAGRFFHILTVSPPSARTLRGGRRFKEVCRC